MFYSFFLGSFFVMISFFLCLGNSARDCFFISEIFYIFFFLFLIIRSIKRNGLVNVYTFFLFFSVFFMFSRFAFDVFGFTDVLEITFPSRYMIKPKSGIILIGLCFFVYLIIDFSYYCARSRLIKQKEIYVSDKVYKILFVFLLITLPLILYKNYLRFQYVQSVGYINYTLNQDDIDLPVYLKGVGWIFNVLFWALIICSSNIRKTKFLWGLYWAVSLLDSLKGNRAAFAINFVIGIYFIIKTSNVNPKRIILILTFVFIGFIAFYLAATNLREGKKNGDINFFQDIVVSLFYAQSVSLNIPLLYIDFISQAQNSHLIPFIFGDYLKFGLGMPVNDVGTFLRQVLYTPKGFGLGYAVLVEIFDLGFFALPFCAFLGWFIKFIDKNFFRNQWLIGFFCLFFMSIIYMPRHIFFDFLSPIRVSWISFGLFSIVFLSNFVKHEKFSLQGEIKL